MNFRAIAFYLLSLSTIRAQTTQLSVVSAASYQGTIAPDSLASIFGANLARTTASGTLDAAGQLPTELAGTRVEVNGQEARLIYVSAAQINFLVPGGIASGATTVTVRSTDTGTSRTAAVQIADSAPAIFSSDASGSGPGAILNAVTFRPAPFVTATADNGSDTRTRLAVYGTGFRHAKAVTARATDAKGNRFDAAVEFAGAAPGFFGLDQLNFIVPADLDGAGAVSLAISTEAATSNIVTFQMNLLDSGSLRLAGLALSPQVVTAGDSMTATVSLNGVARFGGFPVALSTSNLAAQVPPVVTIPEGKASVDAAVGTTSVASTQSGSISAKAGGITLSADFEVDLGGQAELGGINVIPGSTLGGRTLQGTVTLSGRAPAGGINVQIASDNAAVRPPAVVNVPFNQSSASFSIATSSVAGETDATVVASLGRSSVSTKVKLLPLLSLSLDSSTVVGGATVAGSVTLADPAPPGGATIQLSTTDGAAARVPAFITIAAGQNFGSFNITTSTVATARTATISASYQGVTGTAALTVNPQPVPALSTLTVAPDHIPGGQTTQGTVTLTAPASPGGLIVNMQSSSLLTALVPGFVMVPQGQTTAIFTISTTKVAVAQSVTITASANGVTRTATLTVQ